MSARVDRYRAASAFDTYVRPYDAANPRIALKVEHTRRVAELCERIARSEGLPDADVDLAWLLGLLHDIGRFEQVRRFDTFSDARSVSHAALGEEVLFLEPGSDGCPLIRSFLADDAEDGLIRLAVATHSAYRLPEGLDERTRQLCDVLRDADKLDILRVNCECPIEDIYGVSRDAMEASPLSPACVQVFYEHRCIPSNLRAHPADIMLGHICFAWELRFPESVAIAREQGHLTQMLSRRWDQPDTAEAFAAMATHMQDVLGLAGYGGAEWDNPRQAIAPDEMGGAMMTVEQAGRNDIGALVEMRLAYLREDHGELSEDEEAALRRGLPGYFEAHLGRDLLAFAIREAGVVVSCALLLIVEKPMNPDFMSGRTGTVLNVYTYPTHRRRGYARAIMQALLDEAREQDLASVDLKATDDGYPLYRAVGFVDDCSKYHPMKWVNE